MNQTPCSYCNALNPTSVETCVACGAPLEQPVPSVQPEMIRPNVELASVFPSQTDDEALLRAGQTVEKIYSGALTAYAVLWRTLGEAIAIGLVAFGLGLLGGLAEMGFAGVICAAIVGVVVGLVNKPFWLAAISAPAGALVGSMLWLPAWLLGAGPRGLVFTAFVGAVLGAFIGHRPAQKTWWDWLRPFLGAFGGMIIALLGLAIGAGLRLAFSFVGGG